MASAPLAKANPFLSHDLFVVVLIVVLVLVAFAFLCEQPSRALNGSLRLRLRSAEPPHGTATRAAPGNTDTNKHKHTLPLFFFVVVPLFE
jgi:hypothetical protein